MREVFNFKILDLTVRTNQPDKIGVNSDRPAPDGVVGPVFSLHCHTLNTFYIKLGNQIIKI